MKDRLISEKDDSRPTIGEYLFGELGRKSWDIFAGDKVLSESLGSVLIGKKREACKKYGLSVGYTDNWLKEVSRLVNENDIEMVAVPPTGEEKYTMVVDGVKVESNIAYSTGNNTIYYLEGTQLSFGGLRHEVTHALQEKYCPDMDIEERELEASLIEVADSENLRLLRIQSTLLMNVCCASDSWYRMMKKKAPWK